MRQARVLAVIGLQADETALRLPVEPRRHARFQGNIIVLTWREERF